MGAFGATTSRTNGTALVAVHGEIDIYTAPQLWETIDAAIAGLPHELVLDLTDVTFMDSTGLSVLVRAHKRLRSVSGAVIVRGAGQQAIKAITLTKLNKVLTIEPASSASA